jgi:hypothetical protein
LFKSTCFSWWSFNSEAICEGQSTKLSNIFEKLKNKPKVFLEAFEGFLYLTDDKKFLELQNDRGLTSNRNEIIIYDLQIEVVKALLNMVK